MEKEGEIICHAAINVPAILVVENETLAILDCDADRILILVPVVMNSSGVSLWKNQGFVVLLNTLEQI